MKKIIAAVLFAVGVCTSAFAQVTCGTYTNPCAEPMFNPNAYQVSTAGNAGNLTWNLGQGLDGTYSKVVVPGAAFNPITQDFSGVIQADLTGYYTSDQEALAAGGGWVVTGITWYLSGTNGGYSCGRSCSGTDRVIVSQVSIVPAAPTLDASGNAVTGQGYSGDSPLETIPQWSPVPGTAILADGTPATFAASGNAQALQGTSVLQPGKYLVSFTATGCTGRGCNITTYRYFFSTVRFTSHYVSPATTCTTGCYD